jgi:hypothetical protein
VTGDSDNVTADSENHAKIGQHQSERSVIFRRNERSRSIGMGGQLGSEYAPGTGKTHLATAIAVKAIQHHHYRVRFLSTIELVNELEQEQQAGKPGRIAN